MSLEAILAENTAALKEMTAVLLAGNEGRAEALAAAKTMTEKTVAPKKAAAAAAAPAEKAAEPAPAAAVEPAAAPAETAAKPPVDLSADPVAKSISDYVSFTSDTDQLPTSKEERVARSAEVKRIMGTVGATKHSEIPADKHAIFIKTMVSKLAAGNLIVAEEAATEEEPDALLG